MRAFVQSAYLLLLASTCLQGAARAAAQGVGMVKGTVRYEDTDKAAGGITVALIAADDSTAFHADPNTGEYVEKDMDGEQEENRLSVQVKPDGTFTFKDVPAGTYLVHASSPGYVSPDEKVYPTLSAEQVAKGSKAESEVLRVVVKDAQPTNHVDVLLRRGGVIKGVMRTADGVATLDRVMPSSAEGRPLGLLINASHKVGPNSYVPVGRSANINENGYWIEGLAPGDYVVFTGPPIFMVHAANGDTVPSSGLPVYAPQTVRASLATVVHISGSETHHLDIFFAKDTSLHHIEGSIDVSDENSLRSAYVQLYPKNENELSAFTPLAANKGFSFQGVPDGDYTAEVHFEPTPEVVRRDNAADVTHMRLRQPLYATASQDVHVAGGDVTGVVLRPARVVPDGAGH